MHVLYTIYSILYLMYIILMYSILYLMYIIILYLMYIILYIKILIHSRRQLVCRAVILNRIDFSNLLIAQLQCRKTY